MSRRRGDQRDAGTDANSGDGKARRRGRTATMMDYPGGWVLMLLIGVSLAMTAGGQGWVVCLVILAMILSVPLAIAADGARRRLHIPRPVTLAVIPIGLVVVILASLALGGVQIGNALAQRLSEAEVAPVVSTPAPPRPVTRPVDRADVVGGLSAAPTASDTQAVRLADKIVNVVYASWMDDVTSRQDLGDTLDDWLRTAHRYVYGLAGQLLSGLQGVVTGLGVLLVSVLIAAEPKKYQKIFLTLFPPALRPRVEPVALEVGARLGRWAVARGISASALAIMTWVGLEICGVPWAAGIGLITGLVSFIPVIGTVIGGAVAFLTVILTGQGSLVGTIIVFVAANIVETYVLLPVLLQRAVNILPGFTIGSLLVMGTIGGLPGMLIASPLVLIISTVAETSRDEYPENPAEPAPSGDD